jgi:hypothetical protein
MARRRLCVSDFRASGIGSRRVIRFPVLDWIVLFQVDMPGSFYRPELLRFGRSVEQLLCLDQGCVGILGARFPVSATITT